MLYSTIDMPRDRRNLYRPLKDFPFDLSHFQPKTSEIIPDSDMADKDSFNHPLMCALIMLCRHGISPIMTSAAPHLMNLPLQTYILRSMRKFLMNSAKFYPPKLFLLQARPDRVNPFSVDMNYKFE
jgi:hypothetical protein